METFVVRVWTPEDHDGWSPGVRGTATHLASGDQVTFTETDGLIGFIVRALSQGNRAAADADAAPSTSKGQKRL
ncbi:MAG: hypothetical protein WB808_07135 [Candidatus Dormiibacterota bacterium]